MPTAVAFLLLTILASTESTAPWWNKPGLELWKFLNLFLFLIALVYFLRKVLGIPELLKTRREGIRRELTKARQEREAALAKLQEVEARLDRLDDEVSRIREQSIREAAEERERIRRATEEDAKKLRERASREIEAAGKAARLELRIFAAEESVQLAEKIIRNEMRSEDDERLIKLEVDELEGAHS